MGVSAAGRTATEDAPSRRHWAYTTATRRRREAVRATTAVMTPFDVKCQHLQMSPTHFCVRSYRVGDIKNLNLLPPISRSRSWTAIIAITPFDCECQKLQMSPIHSSVVSEI